MPLCLKQHQTGLLTPDKVDLLSSPKTLFISPIKVDKVSKLEHVKKVKLIQLGQVRKCQHSRFNGLCLPSSVKYA